MLKLFSRRLLSKQLPKLPRPFSLSNRASRNIMPLSNFKNFNTFLNVKELIHHKRLSRPFSSQDSQRQLFSEIFKEKEGFIPFDSKFDIQVEKAHHMYHGEQLKEALQYFDEQAKTAEDPEEVYVSKGMFLLSTGRYTDAMLFGFQLASTSKNINVFKLMATILQRLNLLEDSMIFLNEMTYVEPNEHISEIYRGIVFLNFKMYHEALECFNTALLGLPNNAEIHQYKGYTLSRLGQFKEAIQSLDRAIELDPTQHIAHLNKGVALCGLERYQESLRSFDKAIDINPDHMDSFMKKGDVLRHLKEYEDAIECYDAILEKEPKDSYAVYKKAETLSESGKEQEGQVLRDTAYKLRGGEALLNASKIEVLSRMSKHEQVIDVCNEVLTFHKSHYEALVDKGASLSQLGRPEEAIECFDKIIRNKELIDANPTLVWAYYFKAELLHNQGNSKEAIQYIEVAYEYNHEDEFIKKLREDILKAAGEEEKI